MKTWCVYISETYSGYVDIEADSKDSAYEKAVQLLNSRDIDPQDQFDGDTIIEVNEENE
jgi:hypothetical protein